MPQSDNEDNAYEIEKNEKEEGGFLSLSYEEMRQLLERSRKRAEDEREEFLRAWLAAPVRYNIK